MRSPIMLTALSLGGALRYMAEAGAEGAEGITSAPVSQGTTIRPNTDHYVKVKSASGATSKACGDETSMLLAGATLDEVYPFVAKVTGQDEAALREKYGTKNPGQQRMFLGNLIRGGLASKDEKKVATIQKGLSDHQVSFRKAVDVRLGEEAKVADQRRSEVQKARDEAKAKREGELKAKREAEKKARDEKKAADVKARADKKAAEQKARDEKKAAEAQAKAEAAAAKAAAKVKPAAGKTE